jgi:hypothetical protein
MKGHNQQQPARAFLVCTMLPRGQNIVSWIERQVDGWIYGWIDRQRGRQIFIDVYDQNIIIIRTKLRHT